MTEPARRFPVGLTIAVGVCLVILVGLGTWQLQRLSWKEGLLAKIAALQAAPATSGEAALEQIAAGADLDFTRIRLKCVGLAAAPYLELFSVREGKAGVRRMFLGQMGGGKVGLKKGVLFNHIQVQGVVDVAPDGKTAKARYRTIVQVQNFGGLEGFWSDGVYENEYVKEDGVWKFSKLKFWPTYYTPFHEGWSGRQLDCINGDGSGTSPGADRPSTDKAGVYPNIYYPPFHCPNPVTGKPVDVSALNAKALAETTWPKCPSRGGAAPTKAGNQP